MTAAISVSPSRRSAALIALVVSVTHFAAAFVALRALLAATGRGGGSMALHAVVALLAFPLFYTPLPALLDARTNAGLYVAVLNAVLWGALVWGVVRWRTRRGRTSGQPRAGA